MYTQTHCKEHCETPFCLLVSCFLDVHVVDDVVYSVRKCTCSGYVLSFLAIMVHAFHDIHKKIVLNLDIVRPFYWVSHS